MRQTPSAWLEGMQKLKSTIGRRSGCGHKKWPVIWISVPCFTLTGSCKKPNPLTSKPCDYGQTIESLKLIWLNWGMFSTRIIIMNPDTKKTDLDSSLIWLYNAFKRFSSWPAGISPFHLERDKEQKMIVLFAAIIIKIMATDYRVSKKCGLLWKKLLVSTIIRFRISGQDFWGKWLHRFYIKLFPLKKQT